MPMASLVPVSMRRTALAALLVVVGVVCLLSTKTVATQITTTSNSNNKNDDDDNHKADDNFRDFVAHHETQTCTPHDNADRAFPKDIWGVNLGGWMVLEPWITPSLFYQFLGKDQGDAAMDMYTFCQVLGPEEGNRQLRHHWETWLTRDIVNELADSGAVNSFRLPVGDWMYEPYGPYVGCTDGALEYVDRLLDWARERQISVLLDMHGLRGSQNGFDNSGLSGGLLWTSSNSFTHWTTRSASWMGEWNATNQNYTSLDTENVAHSLRVVQNVVMRYQNDVNILGLSPVNEPWEETPEEALKSYYWEAYLIVKTYAPEWKYVIHDSFRFEVKLWGGFMKGCPDRALDTHLYQAWNDPGSRIALYDDACGQKVRIAEMEREFGPVIVGEWSLATDNCAMWLNGFNDNAPGYPRMPCKFVECGDSYLKDKQPGLPLDPLKGPQSPFGSGGVSGPEWGFCPTGRDWWKESSGAGAVHETGVDWWMRRPAAAPSSWDDTDQVMSALAHKKLHAFLGHGHGSYFWNFRTDLYHPQWSYMAALQRGWIPQPTSRALLHHACSKEDSSLFTCVAKRGTLENSTRSAVLFALEQHLQRNNDQLAWKNLHGAALYQQADAVFDRLWKKFRSNGTACWFNGTAELVDTHETYPDLGNYYCEAGDNTNKKKKNATEHGGKNSRLLPTFVWVLLGMAVGTLMGVRMGRSPKSRSTWREIFVGILFAQPTTTRDDTFPGEEMSLVAGRR